MELLEAHQPKSGQEDLRSFDWYYLWQLCHNDLFTLKHTDHVFSVAFSPDGKTLATGSENKTIKLWDVATRQELATLNGHKDEVISVAFSPQGKTLASGGMDSTIKLWHAATEEEVSARSK